MEQDYLVILLAVVFGVWCCAFSIKAVIEIKDIKVKNHKHRERYLKHKGKTYKRVK